MAQFPKVNGDNLPVLNYDSGAYVNSGPNALQSNAPIQPQGPYLAFFTVTLLGTMTGEQLKTIITTAEQLATVMVYEYYNATNDSVALAVYPIDAWTPTSLSIELDAAFGGAVPLTVTGQATFIGAEYPPVDSTVPDAPTVGTAVAASATTATVAVTPEYDGGSPIIGFLATSNVGSHTGFSTTSPVTVTGLTTGTSYTFTVQAINAVGSSIPSDPSNSITTP